MNLVLFPTQYDEGFEQCWRLYRSRCESPNCMRKDEACTVWVKTRNIRPELPIMLRCIALYLDQVEAAKKVNRNGRDEKTTYYKLHFASFLSPNKLAWRDFVDRATASLALSQIAATEAPVLHTRPSFKASNYSTEERTTPLRPASQILAERRERDRQNNSPTPVDTA